MQKNENPRRIFAVLSHYILYLQTFKIELQKKQMTGNWFL
jgi:hypothetical protein